MRLKITDFHKNKEDVKKTYDVNQLVNGGLNVAKGHCDCSNFVLGSLDVMVAQQTRVVVLHRLDRVVLDLNHKLKT